MSHDRWRPFFVSLASILTGLILAYGISQLVRADSMTGASGTSIDAAACATTTADSLCDRVSEIGATNPGANPVANSYLDRINEPAPVTIWTGSRHSVGPDLASYGATISGVTWTASRAFYCPIRLTRAITVAQLAMYNGATVSGNVDIGIYNSAGTRQVSAGSTAHSGASALQVFDVTNTTIGPGLFYLAFAISNVTGTVFGYTGDAPRFRLMGCYGEASAMPLPATATFSTTMDGSLPLIGLSTSTTF